MRNMYTTVIAVAMLLCATALGAQTPPDKLTPPLPTAAERRAADRVSTVSVLASIGLDALSSWRNDQRGRAFVLQGVRLGVTGGVVFLVKQLVNRQRPCVGLDEGCGLDSPNASFFSGHTAFAFQTVGGPGLTFALPLAIGTGGLRIAAGRHWLTDTLVGAGVGLATSRIR